MSDRRDQIPLGCAINVAIVNEFSKTKEFREACVNIPIRLGIKPPKNGTPWPFINNSSWAAYMMYSSFVVFKELYNLPKEDVYFQHLISNNAMKDFRILKQRTTFNEDPLYHFSSFRNAVSHVNFIIDDDDKINLWDHPPKKPEPEYWHWNVEISNYDFLNFLTLVNEENIQLYKEIKNGSRNSDGTKK